MASVQTYEHQYINGKWVKSTNAPKKLDVIDSNTSKVIATVPDGSKEDMIRAVTAARNAFPSWSSTPLAKRKEYIANFLDSYKLKSPEAIKWLMTELGCTKAFAENVQLNLMEWHGRTLLEIIESVDWYESAGNSTVVKEPIGVVGAITPWNYPINQIALKVLPALLAGCTVVLKPSELTPVTAYLIAEALHETKFPPGVFNMVLGTGLECGSVLSTHPDVDMVSFTGSTRAGKQISVAASDTLKRVSTELGGKSAAIILDDADLESVMPKFLQQLMNNSGQSCNALSRMLVPRTLYEKAQGIAKDFAESCTPGRSDDPNAKMGPLVSQLQWDRVQALIKTGIEEGARVVTGGPGKPKDLEDGFFVKPTIFADVNTSMTIAREEIFGPVLAMIPYDKEEEAVKIANDTIYGLNNAVASSNTRRCLEVVSKLRSGMVMVNGTDMDFHAPFGGYKQSGNAREWGKYGLEEFLLTKTVNLPVKEYEEYMPHKKLCKQQAARGGS
eukprot:TRINITY_DN47968_c0_g1_i1.p1 TRINITY_DN47968_c0_g1~~TRINITY_DN47968_c0_g1_i1.p1  ORF type:complete len:501 (-),score=100.00 TRINITY_DN47968_c0_g1_i1:428-1930(-)